MASENDPNQKPTWTTSGTAGLGVVASLVSPMVAIYAPNGSKAAALTTLFVAGCVLTYVGRSLHLWGISLIFGTLFVVAFVTYIKYFAGGLD